MPRSRWYGSLNNRIAEQSAEAFALPKVGDGVTKLMYSDRYAYTVVEVSKTGKTCYVTKDMAVRIDSNGQSESQVYRFESQPNGTRFKLTLRRRGWKADGDSSRWLIGERDEYIDPSF